MAAAAIGDADGATSWVTKAAADQRSLMLWSQTSAVLSPLPAIRQNVFPWNNVTAHAGFSFCVARLEVGTVAARAEVAKTLERFERRVAQPRRGRRFWTK